MAITAEQKRQILNLIDGQRTKTDIAVVLGLKPANVRHFLRQQGHHGNISSKPYRSSKYSKDLIAAVMQFFQNHSYEETSKEFSLTAGQLKSVFSYGYTDKSFSHLRKTPAHLIRQWNVHEMLTLLRYSGFLSRNEIAHKLKRTIESVKGELDRLNISSAKNIGGLTMSDCERYFPATFDRSDCISGNAGPSIMKFAICPWFIVWDRIKHNRYIDPLLRKQIIVMKSFQLFLWQGIHQDKIIRLIKSEISYAKKFRPKTQIRGIKIVHSDTIGKPDRHSRAPYEKGDRRQGDA